MQNPINYDPLSATNLITVWERQGGQFVVGGNFTTVPGKPSQQLLPSLNTLMGYFNGQMLSTADGDGTGIYADLTPGALINFDPASTDSGQSSWNGFIIADPGLVEPLDLNITYPGTLQVATPKQNWVIRQQYLYAAGVPQTDILAVAAAVQPYAIWSQIMNSGNVYETIFAY